MSDIWQKVGAENLVRHKSGNYYLQATVGGKKVRKSLKTSDIRTAKSKRDQELSKLRLRVPGAADAIKTIAHALAIVEAREMAKPNLKPRTKEYYTEIHKLLRATLPIHRAFQGFTEADAAHWWSEIATRKGNKPRSASQRNNMLRSAKLAASLALKAGVITADPFVKLSRLKLRKSAVEKLPSRQKFGEIIDHIRNSKRAFAKESADFCELLAWSGMRKGEARAAMWEDDQGDWFRIHGGEAGTKNSETRMLPVNPQLRAVLDRMKPKDASGPILSTKSPAIALKAACADCKVTPGMRVHDLRHLFATMAIESGVDIPTVAKWLGHKDGGLLAMKTYGHLRDDHSLAAARRMA